ncbi:hypothetical protein DFH08DRAFT_812078 [Mycena albidolilacea]|uniref:Uncharacterized protein n=1 Tax=Mycena albidolilacea TaxID=1033008 RepID=A0AAD6ZU00_9AGAR|nr:hypothetical protein DFH08DRAFT_812078 [Mycena albidolilacea]
MFLGPTGQTLSLYGPTSSRTRFIPLRFFCFGVTYTRNASLCIQVAKQAMRDLKDTDTWLSGIKCELTEPEPWDLPFLNELAKESFRNLKKSWRMQTNPNAAAKAKIGRQSERQNKRRKAKTKNICKIVDTFGTAQRLQPDFLRDISHKQWKKSQAPMRILVRATKRGRSGILVQRNERKQSTKIYLHIPGLSSHRIPIYAPYNFGISDDWLAENRRKPEKEQLLDD